MFPFLTDLLMKSTLLMGNPCQTYLSESEDDGGYGNVALGRSFALEMGSFIPQSDRRLGELL